MYTPVYILVMHEAQLLGKDVIQWTPSTTRKTRRSEIVYLNCIIDHTTMKLESLLRVKEKTVEWGKTVYSVANPWS